VCIACSMHALRTGTLEFWKFCDTVFNIHGVVRSLVHVGVLLLFRNVKGKERETSFAFQFNEF
jgi:hypothetical protein